MDPVELRLPNAPNRAATNNVKAVAKELEAVFVKEMLKSAGVGKPPESFGGGAGEDQFSSFLISEYADKISQAGGFGLAENIFQALTRDGGQSHDR